MKFYFKLRFIWTFITYFVLSAFLKLGTQFLMYYKLRCNSTQFVIYYKLRNYYKLQRNKAESIVLSFDTPYYTELPAYSQKRRLKTGSFVLHTRGSSLHNTIWLHLELDSLIHHISISLSKWLVSLMRNWNIYGRRPSGAPIYTSLNHMTSRWFCNPSYFEAVYCFICGRRMVTVVRYRMICLVLTTFVLLKYHTWNMYGIYF